MVPESLWFAALAVLLIPGIYGLHLFLYAGVFWGLGIFVCWAGLHGALLWLVHRRRWARLWLTVPATVVLVAMGVWVLRAMILQ